MKNVTSKPELSHSAIETNSHLFDDWFDPIEDMIRGQVRGLIEEMIRGELDATLSRPRYGRRAGQLEGGDSATVVTGHRHGSRVRTLTGTFGKTEIAVPRALRSRHERHAALATLTRRRSASRPEAAGILGGPLELPGGSKASIRMVRHFALEGKNPF